MKDSENFLFGTSANFLNITISKIGKSLPLTNLEMNQISEMVHFRKIAYFLNFTVFLYFLLSNLDD